MSDLKIEDGTGMSDSDSFISVADADLYMSDMGYSDWETLEQSAKEAQLRRAALYLAKYNFKGIELNPESQALVFPRWIPVSGGKPSQVAIPRAVKNAQCELAMIDDLGAASNGSIAKMQKVDVIEIEYDTKYASPNDVYPMVESILRKLLDDGSTTSDFASMRTIKLRKVY